MQFVEDKETNTGGGSTIPSLEQKIALHQNLKLTLKHQQQLEKHWNEINSRRDAYIPSDLKDLRWPEIRDQNTALGDFAVSYLSTHFFKVSEEEAIENMRTGKMIVAVGFGRNYDSHWLQSAMEAGYQVVWIDISTVACAKAEESMKEQYDAIKGDWSTRRVKPLVIHAEIQTLLADPSVYGIDPKKVAVWYFCRTLTCMSKRSAKTVLQLIGEYSFSEPGSNAKICLISAFKDENPNRVGKASKLYLKKDILRTVQKGALCPLEIVGDEPHIYFNQNYSGFTIQRKQ